MRPLGRIGRFPLAGGARPESWLGEVERFRTSSISTPQCGGFEQAYSIPEPQYKGIEFWSKRNQLLRDRYPADGVSQLTRSNQWLIRPLQLQIKIVRESSSCPPPLHYRHPMTLQTGRGPQPQTGDLNYYGWKLRPVGSSLVSFARVLFQLHPVSHYLSPVSCLHLFYLLPNIVHSPPLSFCKLRSWTWGLLSTVHCMPWCIVATYQTNTKPQHFVQVVNKIENVVVICFQIFSSTVCFLIHPYISF